MPAAAMLTAAILLLGHAAAAVWMAALYERSHDPWSLLSAAALPVAQVGLLSAWIARGRLLSYVRVPAAVVAMTALWALECRVLGLDLADDRCAAHALAFAVQALLVTGVLAVVRVLAWLVAPWLDPQQPPRRIQFGVGFLLGWIAAVAVVLGAWKVALIHSNWPWDVVKGDLFLFGAVVGAYNALFALIAIAGVFLGRRGWTLVLQVPLALGLVAAAAWSQPVILQTLFDRDGSVESIEWMVLAGFQTAYLLVTLVPLRLSGYNKSV